MGIIVATVPPYVPIKPHFVRARHDQPLRRLAHTACFYLLFTTLLFSDSISIRLWRCHRDCQSAGKFDVLKIRWPGLRSRFSLGMSRAVKACAFCSKPAFRPIRFLIRRNLCHRVLQKWVVIYENYELRKLWLREFTGDTSTRDIFKEASINLITNVTKK